MNTQSLCFSRLFRSVVLVGVMSAVVGYSTVVDAAQGCGQGRHLNRWGYCVMNHPGRWATPAPYHAGCWRNFWGQLRCYRR